jgi:predicted nucleic acid-binding protein
VSRIVSNASPLIVLAKAGLLDLLPKVFSEILVPQGVRMEIESGPTNDSM